MAVKGENKTVRITFTPYHLRKLQVMCAQMGLSKTGVIQRLIEKCSVVEKKGDPTK